MSRFFRRKKFCRFTVEKVVEIDYKDIATLKQYVSETNRIIPCRNTGTKALPAPADARHQVRALPGVDAVLRQPLSED